MDEEMCGAAGAWGPGPGRSLWTTPGPGPGCLPAISIHGYFTRDDGLTIYGPGTDVPDRLLRFNGTIILRCSQRVNQTASGTDWPSQSAAFDSTFEG
jgi:hypothetical protein